MSCSGAPFGEKVIIGVANDNKNLIVMGRDPIEFGPDEENPKQPGYVCYLL
ncbi:MAG TPA: hypothetical protein VIO64_19680 [Pseudobacteroides sp.]|uniref:hypothetical protein n=1 Tax=Pseudobacteroides sp. TaxID=1968840 RepID=UPI002F92CC61